MKLSNYLALGLLVFGLSPAWELSPAMADEPENFDPNKLTKFNLDFPGGDPAELVKAIQKATGKPLNVIIPTEYAKEAFPALKMNGVNVAQLFQALQRSSVKDELVDNSQYYGSGAYGMGYQHVVTSYGFDTRGEISDDSIWYFFGRNHTRQTTPRVLATKVCRFYQLAPFLDRGLTVEDIITAIHTGWKMLGEAPSPEVTFHKETKVLIAVGEAEKLAVIDNVLKALQPSPTTQLPAPPLAERTNATGNPPQAIRPSAGATGRSGTPLPIGKPMPLAPASTPPATQTPDAGQ